MNYDIKIQFKKNVGVLRNAEAFDEIVSITFVGANKEAGDTTITMEAGNSASSLEEVDATTVDGELTYNLNGATFFKFSNSGKGVLTCDSIVITFAK